MHAQFRFYLASYYTVLHFIAKSLLNYKSGYIFTSIQGRLFINQTIVSLSLAMIF